MNHIPNRMKTLSVFLALAFVSGISLADEKAKSKTEFPIDVRLERDVAYLPAEREEKADLYLPLESPKDAQLSDVLV